LRAACDTGGATLMVAGLNPGFIAEQVATVASGVCLSAEHIEITEAADATEVRDPAYLFGALGFGADPAAFDPNDAGRGPAVFLNGMYTETLAAVALRLGMDLERVETTHLDDPHPPLCSVKVTGHPGIEIAVRLVKYPDDRSRMGAEQYAVAGQVIHSRSGGPGETVTVRAGGRIVRVEVADRSGPGVPGFALPVMTRKAAGDLGWWRRWLRGGAGGAAGGR
jgi:2,4-diaminopentanoate dehydrogenase